MTNGDTKVNTIIEAVKKFCDETDATYKIDRSTGDFIISLGSFKLFEMPGVINDRFRLFQHHADTRTWTGHSHIGENCDPSSPRLTVPYDPDIHGEKYKRAWEEQQSHSKIDSPQAVYEAMKFFWESDHTKAAVEMARATMPAAEPKRPPMPPIIK